MKKVKLQFKMLIVLILSLSFSISLAGGASEDQNTSTSVGSYKTRRISANPDYAAKYHRPSKGDPVNMAYEFFELNQEFFGINDPRKELAIRRVESNLIGSLSTMVSFKQLYNGIELMYSDIRAFFKDDGQLRDVQGDYHYDINLSTTPSIDSATSENLALKDLGFPKNAKIVKTHQYWTKLSIWCDNNDKLHLIWVVWVHQEYPELHAWECFIDAHDGTVLKKADRVIRN
jgi:Zn-dependent metalloprotease